MNSWYCSYSLEGKIFQGLLSGLEYFTLENFGPSKTPLKTYFHSLVQAYSTISNLKRASFVTCKTIKILSYSNSSLCKHNHMCKWMTCNIFLGHESRTKQICSENFLVWLLPYKAIWKASWMDEILLCWILMTSWTFNMCSCEFKSSHLTIAIFNTRTYVQLLMAATTGSVTIAINCICRLHVYQK